MSRSKGQLKLSAVVYKCQEDSGALTGIGLEFADGHKSPIFQTEAAKNEAEKKIIIDTTKDISKISMLINKQQQLQGLSFVCKNDKNYYNEQQIIWDHTNPSWYKKGYQNIIQDIPDGMEIIGVRCTTSSSDKEIPRLAFTFWKPRRYWRAFDYGVPEILPPTLAKEKDVVEPTNNAESAT